MGAPIVRSWRTWQGPEVRRRDRIFWMRNAARIAILLMLLAALPLRGYASVLMSLCDTHHGGASSSQEHTHEHGDGHDHDSDEGSANPSHAASVCSICASCCAGSGLAPDAPQLAVFQAPGCDRIPFFDQLASGFVPEHRDRPPLSR